MAKHTTGSPDAGRSVRAGATGARRYHRDAMLAVLRMLGTVGEDVASIFATIVMVRGDRKGADECALPLDAMAVSLGLNHHELRTRLLDVDRRFASAFSINLLDWDWRRAALGVGAPLDEVSTKRRTKSHLDEGDLFAEKPIDFDEVLLAKEFVELLDEPVPDATRSALVPTFDRSSQRGLAVLESVSIVTRPLRYV